jgi:hypothetical protein
LDLLVVKEVLLLVLAFSTAIVEVEELLAETTSILTKDLDLLVKAKNARKLLQSATQNQQAVTVTAQSTEHRVVELLTTK